MIIQCTKEQESQLFNYLKEEAVYNTFLLADIMNYGFDKDFQTVYGEFDENGNCHGVYLRFYENLIVYTKTDDKLSSPVLTNEGTLFLNRLFCQWTPAVIMGKADTVCAINSLLDTEKYSYSERPLYLLENDTSLIDTNDFSIHKGTSKDAEDIYRFLASIDEMKTLYSSKEMIADRLENGDGTHYFIKNGNTLIGHANSAAVSIYTVMIGGVATAVKHRNRTYASALVSALCRDILASGKKPCLFCTRNEEHNLFCRLGFFKAGSFGVLERRG